FVYLVYSDIRVIYVNKLNNIPKKESNEFIKSSVEDLVPIPSESDDTSGSDSDDDESPSDEDVPKDNVKMYSNPLFKFDDEYISSDVNPLFNEVLENIESKNSYDSNLDEPDLLVTPLSDANKDECFDSGGNVDEINDFEDGYYDSEGDILYLESFLNLLVTPLSDANKDECFDPGGDVDEINDFEDGYYDSKGDILYLESLLSDDTTPNLPPEVFLDRDLRILSDAPIDNLMSEDKIFDPVALIFAILSLPPFLEIPSGETKVHIEVLPVLWGNRLPIPDGLLPLSRYVVPTSRVIVPTGRYVVSTGRVIVPTGRESKARTTLLQSIPDDHVADFHYMDDARDIWNAVKARFGGNAESKKMRKSMLKQEFLEFRTGDAGEFALMGVTYEVHNYPFGCDRENELGWDDSAFSVFTTNSEDVEGRPIFHRFAKTDSMKVLHPSLSGDYTSLSDHTNLDESQMSYGIKSSTSSDSNSVSNDFVSCDDSDKSSEVNKNNFASSDSSVKSLEPKPNDSTSCASTSSVSTSVNEVEIQSNVNIPPARPQPVPTGKPKVFAPVPVGRQNRPFLVPTDKGYSPSVVLGNYIEKVYTRYPRTIVDLIHLHTDDNVADLLTKAFDGPRVFNSPMLHLMRVEMVINSPWIMPILGTKELTSPEQTAPELDWLLIHQGDVMIPPKD
nr:xylulose kinase-1 [Tanacetum cinerariifolium]